MAIEKSIEPDYRNILNQLKFEMVDFSTAVQFHLPLSMAKTPIVKHFMFN